MWVVVHSIELCTYPLQPLPFLSLPIGSEEFLAGIWPVQTHVNDLNNLREFAPSNLVIINVDRAPSGGESSAGSFGSDVGEDTEHVERRKTCLAFSEKRVQILEKFGLACFMGG
jgi:hypothetical protein